MDTQEEGEDSTKEKEEEEEEDPPSTEKIPESYSRRLAEIYLEMADVHQRKSQIVDEMMGRDLKQELQDALFDNLKLLTQVERRLNDLVALYYCLVKHQIF
jgi:NTP pyrophosphatase (non-canonical NTP hydrolase)